MKELELRATVRLPEGKEEPDMLRLDLSVLLRILAIDILVKQYRMPPVEAAALVAKFDIKERIYVS